MKPYIRPAASRLQLTPAMLIAASPTPTVNDEKSSFIDSGNEFGGTTQFAPKQPAEGLWND